MICKTCSAAAGSPRATAVSGRAGPGRGPATHGCWWCTCGGARACTSGPAAPFTATTTPPPPPAAAGSPAASKAPAAGPAAAGAWCAWPVRMTCALGRAASASLPGMRTSLSWSLIRHDSRATAPAGGRREAYGRAQAPPLQPPCAAAPARPSARRAGQYAREHAPPGAGRCRWGGRARAGGRAPRRPTCTPWRQKSTSRSLCARGSVG
jgi:hypothetical protein